MSSRKNIDVDSGYINSNPHIIAIRYERIPRNLFHLFFSLKIRIDWTYGIKTPVFQTFYFYFYFLISVFYLLLKFLPWFRNQSIGWIINIKTQIFFFNYLIASNEIKPYFCSNLNSAFAWSNENQKILKQTIYLKIVQKVDFLFFSCIYIIKDT